MYRVQQQVRAGPATTSTPPRGSQHRHRAAGQGLRSSASAMELWEALVNSSCGDDHIHPSHLIPCRITNRLGRGLSPPEEGQAGPSRLVSPSRQRTAASDPPVTQMMRVCNQPLHRPVKTEEQSSPQLWATPTPPFEASWSGGNPPIDKTSPRVRQFSEASPSSSSVLVPRHGEKDLKNKHLQSGGKGIGRHLVNIPIKMHAGGTPRLLTASSPDRRGRALRIRGGILCESFWVSRSPAGRCREHPPLRFS